jgi:hypothetical protein
MSVGDYDNVPADCGEDVVAIAAAHKEFSDSTAHWDAMRPARVPTGTRWTMFPNASTIWDEPK